MRVFHRLVIAYAFHLIDQREIQVSGHEAGTEALDAVWRMGGSLARKGAARIAPLEGVGDSASAEWRKAVQEARDKDLGTDFTPDEWIRVDDVRDEASGAPRSAVWPACRSIS